jgi:hypothetical protein
MFDNNTRAYDFKTLDTEVTGKALVAKLEKLRATPNPRRSGSRTACGVI